MDVLRDSAVAERKDELTVPSLKTLARGIDRCMARHAGEAATSLQAWLTSRWSIGAWKANSSDLGGLPRLEDGAVALGWRRYKGDASNMIAAARELRQAEAPAADRELAGMLAAMNAALVTGRQSEAEARLRMGAYVQRLREWPCDVVAEVLHAWPDRNKYWPAWMELRAELERVARPRRTLIADLEWAAATLEPERRAELPMFALKRL